MTEIEFIEYWCKDLTEIQLHMTEYFIKKGYFLGVGRAVGRMVYWPLISKDGKRVSVVDTAGYEQLASIDGRVGMRDYSKMTQEEFDEILEEKLQSMYAVELLYVPGCYEILSEYLNNEILEEWEIRQESEEDEE